MEGRSASLGWTTQTVAPCVYSAQVSYYLEVSSGSFWVQNLIVEQRRRRSVGRAAEGR